MAARGIDITDLAAVVNYDLPRSPAEYLHLIGRTGRAGILPGFEPVEEALPSIHPHGGVKDKREV